VAHIPAARTGSMSSGIHRRRSMSWSAVVSLAHGWQWFARRANNSGFTRVNRHVDTCGVAVSVCSVSDKRFQVVVIPGYHFACSATEIGHPQLDHRTRGHEYLHCFQHPRAQGDHLLRLVIFRVHRSKSRVGMLAS
jgi:hypothetical protein